MQYLINKNNFYINSNFLSSNFTSFFRDKFIGYNFDIVIINFSIKNIKPQLFNKILSINKLILLITDYSFTDFYINKFIDYLLKRKIIKKENIIKITFKFNLN